MESYLPPRERHLFSAKFIFTNRTDRPILAHGKVLQVGESIETGSSEQWWEYPCDDKSSEMLELTGG